MNAIVLSSYRPLHQSLVRACRGLLPFAIIALAGIAISQEPDTNVSTNPVLRLQALPLPHFTTSFQFDGRELTACHYDPADRRVFWYPFFATKDASLTRMGHPHDPFGHSHHNSVWISHADIDGVNFWGDRGKSLGKIQCVAIPREAYTDGDEHASMKMILNWIREEDAAVLLIETRRAELMLLDGAKSWMMVVDMEFTTPKRELTQFNPSPFGVMAVRMAKSIGVQDGKGRILNSEGAINEAAIFRQPARWCDYSGRLTNDSDGFAGITLMNHPVNPEHPTPFHVRDDGWMGACLNLNSTIEVSETHKLRLRYGLWVHDAISNRAECEAIWERFVGLPITDLHSQTP